MTNDYCDSGDQSLMNNDTTSGYDSESLATAFVKQSADPCVCLGPVSYTHLTLPTTPYV